MKLSADTIEEYFIAAGERQSDLRQIDQVIRAAAPRLEPVLFRGTGSVNVIGYGLQAYKPKSAKVSSLWPIVSLAIQKHHIAVYICALSEEGEYLAEINADSLGNVSCGKSCIRFKRASDINQSVLGALLGDIDRRVVAGEKLFGF